jgi:CubicO group peptidase (beta-lactamase class C family)
MKNILILLLLILTANSICSGQNGTIADREQIQKRLNQIHKKSRLPGFAIAVIREEDILFSEGFGYADKKKKTPFTTKTIMPVGSVSKTFVGLAIVKGVELGYFDLDTPVNDILPFPVVNPHRPGNVITIRHLATHTSGIIDYEPVYIKTYQAREKPDMPLSVFLEKYLKTDGEWYSKNNFDDANTGEKFNYSNIGAALAAHLIEIKSGMSFDIFSEKYLFQPLKLANTHWFFQVSKKEQYATLYEVNKPDRKAYGAILNKDNSLRNYSSVTYPDGSLKTNIDDISRYLIEIMKGCGGASELISQEHFPLLFKKQFKEENTPLNMIKSEPNRAIFWAYNRKGRLTHTGSDPGLFAAVSIDLETMTARAILVNANIENGKNKKTVQAIQEIIAILDEVE